MFHTPSGFSIEIMYKHIVYKSLVLVKLGSLVAKLSLFCTAVSTVATLLDTIDNEMGWAIDMICVATYLFARSVPFQAYEKTPHVPPVKKEKHYAFTAGKINGL